jgi:hypothetical protein
MKKGTFYILNRKGFGNNATMSVMAVDGYIDGDLGFNKIPGPTWVVTHIPTGLKLTAESTRREALEQARQIVSSPSFAANAAAAKRTEYHKFFETEIQKLQEK